ncbi:MAG: helix-turn-helix transcriptional regulator [Paracoccaceae bacterium]
MDGAEIWRLRRRAGLTQEALAEHIGVEQGTVSRWERDIERPRPRSANALRNVLLVDTESAVTLRQTMLVRNNMIAGGFMDSESRLREMSGLGVDFYRKRGNFDIQADFGKTLQRALCEKGGHHSWEVVQKSEILTGQALLVRLFISVEGLSYLTHYEPVYQNGEFSGIFGYLARIVPKGIAPGKPFIHYADAIHRDDPGKVAIVHRSTDAETVKSILSDIIP